MTAKDYLTALKVIREIQRKQAYCSGQSKPYLADTLKEIEMYSLGFFQNWRSCYRKGYFKLLQW